MVLPGRQRCIIHIDMDAFYASVEQLDNPSLRGRAVIVGGSSHRGVVSAASYEARTFGIHSAMPMARARNLCPDGCFLPVRMDRYRQISTLINAIFHRYTPLVEPLSLDEAFLDVTDSGTLFGNGERIAKQIRKEILKETGLTASAGVATSKLIAKIASDFDKPDGLTIVTPGTEMDFIAPLPISRLWGAGNVTVGQLHLLGVETIGDLRDLSFPLLKSKFGISGKRLFDVCRGIDTRPVTPDREIKSIGHEDTYEEDLRDMESFKKEILFLADKLARRMRRYGVQGRTVTLKIKHSDFRQQTRSSTMATATDDHHCIYREAVLLLEKKAVDKKPVRLLGITMSKLEKSDRDQQLQLFHEREVEDNKRRQINKAMDLIHDRFGGTAIGPAALMGKRR